MITYDNIQKVATAQADGYTTGYLLHYNYFSNYYKMIAIDLSQQRALDADPKAKQQISFTTNLNWDGNTTMFFIIEQEEETILVFSEGTVAHYNTLNVKSFYLQLNKLKSGITKR